ncbi:MAG: hypothetical protein JO305_06140 [Alphaproteobacteria bacterium]|nr:hypothetical protein [Alphaproteobacteria bacterium]
MPVLQRGQLISAIMSVVIVLFVGRALVAAPYRSWLRRAAITGFLIALGLAIVSIGAWLLEG